jgi:hypothetical protein
MREILVIYSPISHAHTNPPLQTHTNTHARARSCYLSSIAETRQRSPSSAVNYAPHLDDHGASHRAQPRIPSPAHRGLHSGRHFHHRVRGRTSGGKLHDSDCRAGIHMRHPRRDTSVVLLRGVALSKRGSLGRRLRTRRGVGRVARPANQPRSLARGCVRPRGARARLCNKIPLQVQLCMRGRTTVPKARGTRASPAPSRSPPPFTHTPFPPRSQVRDGQTSPHKPRLVVSHSTCPPLSPSPHANNVSGGDFDTVQSRQNEINPQRCTLATGSPALIFKLW